MPVGSGGVSLFASRLRRELGGLIGGLRSPPGARACLKRLDWRKSFGDFSRRLKRRMPAVKAGYMPYTPYMPYISYKDLYFSRESRLEAGSLTDEQKRDLTPLIAQMSKKET